MLVGVVAAFVALFFGYRQVFPLFTLKTLVSPLWRRAVVALLMALAFVIVHATLATMSSWDVQESVLYTGFYDVLGVAWLVGAIMAMQFLRAVAPR